MGGLGGLADALDKAARDLRARGALDAARAAGDAYLLALGARTPVLTGRLKASERVDAVIGNGERATATIGAHTIYAAFRNRGGTITVKHATVLTNHVEFFGRSVTQAGSHYFDRTNTWAEGGGLDVPVRKAIRAILEDSGL